MSEKYTVRVVARKNKISKVTGEIPICIRTTKDRKSTYVTLFSINLEFWDNQARRVRKSHPNSTEKNKQISDAIAKHENIAYKAIETNNDFGVASIRDRIKKKISKNYIEYVEARIQELKKRGNISMYKRDKCVIDDFKKFLKKDSLPLNQFTPEVVRKFETYLMVDKENQRNTITGKMKRLSKYARDLFEEDSLDMRYFPFRNYKMTTVENVRERLTERELYKIINLRLTPVNLLYDTRQVFLMECFTGFRISDLLTMKWKHYQDGKLVKRMDKNDKEHSIYVDEIEEAEKIINIRYRRATMNNKQLNPESYIFNILKDDVDKVSAEKAHNMKSSATAIINKNLKELAKKTKIKKNLSTHIGRHTFATYLINKDVSIETVSALLGHSDIRTTQVYAKILEKSKINALSVFNKKKDKEDGKESN